MEHQKATQSFSHRLLVSISLALQKMTEKLMIEKPVPNPTRNLPIVVNPIKTQQKQPQTSKSTDRYCDEFISFLKESISRLEAENRELRQEQTKTIQRVEKLLFASYPVDRSVIDDKKAGSARQGATSGTQDDLEAFCRLIDEQRGLYNHAD